MGSTPSPPSLPPPVLADFDVIVAVYDFCAREKLKTKASEGSHSAGNTAFSPIFPLLANGFVRVFGKMGEIEREVCVIIINILVSLYFGHYSRSGHFMGNFFFFSFEHCIASESV